MVELTVEKASVVARNGAKNGSQNGLLYETVDPTATYQIEEPVAVSQFLSHHPYLANLLVEARQQISEIFGQATRVKLELLDDPEFRGNPELFAVILTPLTAEEGLALENQLDQKWWLDNLDRAQGKFNITVGFV
jgi:hypothetical protein